MKRRSFLFFGGLLLFLLFSGSFLPTTWAQTSSQEGPVLKGGQVSPENASWSSSFVFEITFVGSGDDFSLREYPKIRLDGMDMTMSENDPEDDNFSDGKVFRKEWNPGPGDVGRHESYFYILDSSGGKIRYPEENNIKGPLVDNEATGISLELKREDQNLIFSGSLESAEENRGLAGENVLLFKVLRDENVPMGSARIDEDGNFTISLSKPEGDGVFRYTAYFEGDGGYDRSRSDSFYLNTLDALLVIALSSIFFLGILAVLWFGLAYKFSRSKYLMSIILGTLIGMTLLSLLGIFGLLLGGLILGYLLSKEISGWTNQMRVGAVAGALGFSLYGLITLVNIFGFLGSVGFAYSIDQMTFLQNFLFGSLPTALVFILTLALGSVLGGFFRKVLK